LRKVELKAMKMYEGSGDVTVHTFITSALDVTVHTFITSALDVTVH